MKGSPSLESLARRIDGSGSSLFLLVLPVLGEPVIQPEHHKDERPHKGEPHGGS